MTLMHQSICSKQPFNVPNFIPVNTKIADTDEAVPVYIWDNYDLAHDSLNSKVNNFYSVSFVPIKSLNFSLKYSLLDTRREFLAKLAIVARHNMESRVDSLAANGDELLGIKGLLNHEGINKHELARWFDDNGNALKTPQQLIDDISQLVCTIVGDINNTMLAVPDTLLLPIKHFNYLSMTPYSSHSEVSILNYLLSNNPYVKKVNSWVHLKNQCMVYPCVPQAIEMLIPLAFEMLEPQVLDANIHIYCHVPTCGVQIYTPKACAYGIGL